MNSSRFFLLLMICCLAGQGWGATCPGANPTVCWSYTNTGSNHTIIITTTINPLYNGLALPIGSYIGAFYDSSGTLKCGGWVQWAGSNISLSAFGDDSDSPDKDGFASTNDTFRFKVMLPSGEIADNVIATYVPPPGPGFISHTNQYATDGISMLASLSATLTVDPCQNVICNDNNPCTDETCVGGNCIPTGNTASCSDSNACTMSDVCSGGTCSGTLITCNDSNSCTNDACSVGNCIFTNNTSGCNDNNACTNNDICSEGTCSGTALVCNDNNPCTNDSCSGGNCIFTNTTTGCNDNNACTNNDICSGGTCSGTPNVCDDGSAVTLDTCINGVCSNTVLNVSISGGIISEVGAAVPTVTLNLTGQSSKTLTTANDGLYNFDVAPFGSYIVTPSKNNDSVTNNGVSTLDIILIQKQVLSIQPFPLNTPYKMIAADVNGSSTITTLDIVFIRAVILQNLLTFPNGKLWAFVPEDYPFANPLNPFPYDNFRSYINIQNESSNQDFVGIKLGDVNNSWDPNTAKMEAVGDVQFVMKERHVMQKEEIIVPVGVKDFKNVTGYQFTLSWNPKVLAFLEVHNKSLPGYFGMHKTSEGYLTTSWNDDMARAISLSYDETVFELKFKVIGANGTQSKIKIGSELTTSEAYNENLDLLNIVSTNGMVKVIDSTTANLSRNDCCKLKVVPNPFSNSTNIIFNIPEDGTVSIMIYDLLGKEIKHMKVYYKTGEHKIEWSGDNDAGEALIEGLYHVRMVSGEHSTSAKAVLVR